MWPRRSDRNHAVLHRFKQGSHTMATGKKAGTAASKTLRTSKSPAAKRAAASDLAQRPKGKGKKK